MANATGGGPGIAPDATAPAGDTHPHSRLSQQRVNPHQHYQSSHDCPASREPRRLCYGNPQPAPIPIDTTHYVLRSPADRPGNTHILLRHNTSLPETSTYARPLPHVPPTTNTQGNSHIQPHPSHTRPCTRSQQYIQPAHISTYDIHALHRGPNKRFPATNEPLQGHSAHTPHIGGGSPHAQRIMPRSQHARDTPINTCLRHPIGTCPRNEIDPSFLSDAPRYHNEHGVHARMFSHLQNLLTNSPHHKHAVLHLVNLQKAVFPDMRRPALHTRGVIYVIFHPHLPHFYYVGQTRHTATLRMQQHLRYGHTAAFCTRTFTRGSLYEYMRRVAAHGWRTWAILPIHSVPSSQGLHMDQNADFRSRAFPYEYLYMRLLNSLAPHGMNLLQPRMFTNCTTHPLGMSQVLRGITFPTQNSSLVLRTILHPSRETACHLTLKNRAHGVAVHTQGDDSPVGTRCYIHQVIRLLNLINEPYATRADQDTHTGMTSPGRRPYVRLGVVTSTHFPLYKRHEYWSVSLLCLLFNSAHMSHPRL